MNNVTKKIIEKNFELEKKIYCLNKENKIKQEFAALLRKFHKNYRYKINSDTSYDFEIYHGICRELKIQIMKNKHFIDLICYPTINFSDHNLDQLIELLLTHKPLIDFTKYDFSCFKWRIFKVSRLIARLWRKIIHYIKRMSNWKH